MRKLPAMLSMLLLAVLLVACGGDDNKSDPTAVPVEPTTAAVATDVPTQPVATVADMDEATPASPVASPIASPVVVGTPMATPVIGATPIASPVVIGTPAVVATPVAGTSGIVAPVGEGDAPAADLQTLYGTVSLPGTVNERFVMSDDGCVGLGKYAGVQQGQQVVIKDQSGAIVGVAELQAIESSVVCGWTFETEVPVSEFYSVSIPLVVERVFTGEDVSSNDGKIEVVLP